MPARFGPYELQEKIASGGMAALYLGVHTSLGRKVAIKVLPPALAADTSFITRFEREATTLSGLHHENIVSVIDLGEQDDTYFIVMEYVEGTDLRLLLEEVPRFPVEIAMAIIEEIAYGLHAAHDKGIVHRDIKPGNLLLSATGGIKIVDFGLAFRMEDMERMTRLTGENLSLGTPSYMSPEQARDGETDQRSDIYSLGVTAYELLCGKRPFESASPSELREKILNAPAPSLTEEMKLIAPEVDGFVRKMIAKDPADRYQTMSEVLQELAVVMDALERSGHLVQHRRQFLPRFAADPHALIQEIRTAKIERHNDRGIELMSMGPGAYQKARREFDVVLWLDPGNQRARDGLAKIRKEIGDEATVDVNQVFGSAGGADAGTTGEGGSGGAGSGSGGPGGDSEEPGGGILASKYRKPLLYSGVGALLLAFLLFWFGRGGPDEGTVMVTSEPGGALVSVRAADERAFESTGLTTPCMVHLPAGEYTVRVQKSGQEPFDRAVVVEAGREVELNAPLAMARGYLILESDPSGATVRKKGPGMDSFVAHEKALPSTLDIAHGNWSFIAAFEGMSPETADVYVRAGQWNSARLAMTPAETVGWVVVRSNPPGASIAFRRPDAAQFHTIGLVTPCSLGLAAGDWIVKLEVEDRPAVEIEVTTAIGESEDQFVEIPAPMASGTVATGVGAIRVASDPAGASVRYRRAGERNSTSTGRRTPCDLELPAGSWEIVLSKDCYRTTVERATVREGMRGEVMTTLPAAPPGGVKVVVSPLFADFYLDGRLAAKEKRVWEGSASACEQHTIEVRHAEFGSRTIRGFTPASGKTIVIDTVFADKRGR
ncbi:MAG: serine/threonine protein kinase [Gemmatimonadetes bacterium]|nr:serine/threonine protein kinase [Gemmatimonadota bacterium]